MTSKFEYQCIACEKPIPVNGFCKKCEDRARLIELEAEHQNFKKRQEEQQENQNKPVFHKRDSGFQFTQILIKKIYRNSFVAEFKMKFPEVSNEIATSIHSDSVQGCITRVSNFFETELAPEEITVKM